MTEITTNVLVVEDDIGWRSRLQELLEGMGFKVVPATNINQAILQANSGSYTYDLILLDIQLTSDGDREGLFLLEQLREQGVLAPCIPVTSYLDKELAIQLINDYDVVGLLEKEQLYKDAAYVSRVIRKAVKKSGYPVVKGNGNDDKVGAKDTKEIALLAFAFTLVFVTLLLLLSFLASKVNIPLFLIAILMFYVLSFWVAVFSRRLQGKTASEMGRDILKTLPGFKVPEGNND